MLLRDIYDMKHINTFYQHINEGQQPYPLPPGVEEITYDDYHAKNGMLRNIQNAELSKEERNIIGVLFELGKLQKNPNNKKEFEAARTTPKTSGYWSPPGATFGKKVDGTYYLSAFIQDFTHKYYISKSLDDLIAVAMNTIQPEFPGWIEIR
jgi:hypothetical protein